MLDELLAAIALSGEHWLQAEAHRQRGNVLWRRGANDFAAAEEALLLALDTARRQKTRVFELRVALDLAGLYRDLDQRARARDVLEPALLGLPEGQKLLEADKARDLLISLA